MFTVDYKNQQSNSFTIANATKTSVATFSLHEGGRISALQLRGLPIIKDPENTTYAGSFASSVLFPFANRIINGRYSFEDVAYVLDLNFEGENNAIHGLIYNAPFRLVDQKTTADYAQVTFRYVEATPPPGFPFGYKVLLTYTLYEHRLTLSITIENTDTKTFPFALGWHPYFYTSDKSKTTLRYVQANSTNTPSVSTLDCNTFLDDCFSLEDTEIVFTTPDYTLSIDADSSTYLQVYTPPIDQHCVAIEPMTAPANSFNTQIGLRYLKPKEQFNTQWSLTLGD